MRFKSLEGRIATLFLALIIVVQVLGLLVIQQGIDRNARASIATELENGEKVFIKLMEQSAQKQRFSAQVLARDTAFVQAIGNGGVDDRATIESALQNSARRARADLTMLIDAERKVTASSGIAMQASIEQVVIGLLDRAEQADGASTIAVVDHKPVQIVVMPVKAPITIAWVVMGFAINRQLAVDMQQLSALDVAILTRSSEGGWAPVATTLAPAHLPKVARDLGTMAARAPLPFELDIDGSQYSARLLPIGEGAGVLLARSIDAATAQYVRLERTLVALTLLGILVAGVAAVLTAKRVAQPLRELARTARRLERGDYRGQIDVQRDDEIGALAKAFDSMRDGIAKREHEIRRLAYWDTLTGLPNRAQFVLLLGDALAEARRGEHAAFVLMMDLDRFKHVNDVMGHDFGDDLLLHVADRLKQHMAEADATAHVERLGGD